MKIENIIKFTFLTFAFFANQELFAQSMHPDYGALMRFYEAMNGDNWNNNTGWKEAAECPSCSPCDFQGQPWYGLVCENDRVVVINFEEQGNNADGFLPDIKLSELQGLVVNFIRTEQELPDFFGVPKLTLLNSKYSNFTGGFSDLPSLQNLAYVDLRENDLDADISLFESTPLKTLNLQSNKLSGSIPDFTNFNNPENLKIYLDDNNLQGCYNNSICSLNVFTCENNIALPWLGEYEKFCQGEEQIGAYCITDESAASMIVSDCNCVPVPCLPHPDYDNLMVLFDTLNIILDDWKLGAEQITCDPCNLLGEPWEGLECVNGRVTSIKLFNGFSGRLPDMDFSELKELGFHLRNIKGGLPNFSKLPKLEILNITDCGLDGNIPDFSHLHELKTLGITNSNIAGAIPDFTHVPKLEKLNLRDNKLEGKLPQFNNLPLLKELIINSNNIEGEIPDLILNCPQLEVFFASDNKFTGCFPEFVCDIEANFNANYALPYGGNVDDFCVKLSQIGESCGGADFLDSGIIQEDCSCYFEPCENPTESYVELMKLYESTGGQNWDKNSGWRHGYFGLSCNPCEGFTEPVSFWYGRWYGITCNGQGEIISIDMDGLADNLTLNLIGNKLKGTLPNLNLPFLKTLILSGNDISGKILDTGLLPNLEVLGVTNNKLSGSLPSLEENPKLKIFRGSFNQFNGTLPNFNKLPDLNTFTAGFNQLEGCFPYQACNLSLFHVGDNFAMPWFGDHSQFCDGRMEIGAPCIIPGTTEEGYIQSDCSCTDNFVTATHELDFQISISPNPVEDEIEVNIKAEGIKDNLSYKIFDISGSLVQKGNVLKRKINVGLLNSGVFILHISTDRNDSRIVTRFIKI